MKTLKTWTLLQLPVLPVSTLPVHLYLLHLVYLFSTTLYLCPSIGAPTTCVICFPLPVSLSPYYFYPPTTCTPIACLPIVCATCVPTTYLPIPCATCAPPLPVPQLICRLPVLPVPPTTLIPPLPICPSPVLPVPPLPVRGRRQEETWAAQPRSLRTTKIKPFS